jgi:hypothetical protein
VKRTGSSASCSADIDLSDPVDDAFYDRTDAYIHLANDQLADVGHREVATSLTYAAARCNALVGAGAFGTAGELLAAQEEVVEYFVKQYRAMLIEHFEDYVEQFDQLQRPPRNNG